MDRPQEVQQICREVFEDTVRQACSADSEQSNRYIAAIRKGIQSWVMDPMALFSHASTNSFQGILDTMPNPITCWDHVMDVLFHLHVFTRTLTLRPGFDAARVISFTNERSLQPVLNLFVPWIVSQEGGWEDLLQFLHGQEKSVQ